jgi:catechol-2,3-dioxygenase
MKLNHIDLQVSNIDEAAKFFETFFELRCTYRRDPVAGLVRPGVL